MTKMIFYKLKYQYLQNRAQLNLTYIYIYIDLGILSS